MRQAIRLQAPAKLNLGLRVLGRRADGYHLLQSLVVFLDLADTVEIAPAVAWRVRLSGAFAQGLAGEDNLVLRAGRALAEVALRDVAACADLAAEIALEKNIPVAAGLGGGSADAACVLRGLNELWQLGLPLPALQELAAPLGADLAVCLQGTPAMVGGIGEEIAPLRMPSLALVVANPGIPLATKDVFARVAPPYEEKLSIGALANVDDVAQVSRALGNGLTPAALELCPTIGALLRDLAVLEGCRLAQMSGSGATCFAMFGDWRQAEEAAAELQRARPAWFVRACRSLAA